jgi:hypothetical protein
MAGDVRLHTRFQQGHPRAPGNRRLAAIRRPREHQVTLLPPQQRGRRFPARLTCASSAGRASIEDFSFPQGNAWTAGGSPAAEPMPWRAT